MGQSKRTDKATAGIAISLLKCLLTAYLLTGAALLLLALLLYRFQISEGVVTAGILVIYALACLAAGFLVGKCARERRFLWGLCIGTLYFVVLALITVAVNHGFRDFSTHFFTTLMICAGSGMLGGMLS